MKNPLANLVVAVLLAVLLGGAAAIGFTSLREAQIEDWTPPAGPAEPRERVLNALKEIQDDGVHVTPDGREMLDEGGERKLEKLIAGLDTKVHLIVWRSSRGAGAYLDANEQLQEALADEPSVVVIWEGPQKGEVFLTGGDGYVPDLGPSDFVGDPLTTLTELLPNAENTNWYDNETSSDYWGGTGGGVAAGLLMASGAFLVIGLIYWLLVVLSGGLLRLPGGWK